MHTCHRLAESCWTLSQGVQERGIKWNEGPSVLGAVWLLGRRWGGLRYLIWPETSLVEALRAPPQQPLLSFHCCSVARGAHPGTHGWDKQEVNSSSRVFNLDLLSERRGEGLQEGLVGGLGVKMRGFEAAAMWLLCDSLGAWTAATGVLLNSEGASGQLLGSSLRREDQKHLIWFSIQFTQCRDATNIWVTGVSNPFKIKKPILR